MAERRIIEMGDPLLRAISRPSASAAEAAPVFDDLRDTLHRFQRENGFGRGISAVQIGEPTRLIYIELGGRAWRLRNPEFEFQSAEKWRVWDDCFSFPNLMVLVERAVSVRIRYDGGPEEPGARLTLEATGDFAELVQHEMDHLDGVLAVDRAVGRDAFRTRREHLRQLAAVTE